MKKSKATNHLQHLEWLVRCRSQNQRTSLALYKLMSVNIPHLKKNGILASVGISLVAVSFNLWRAVFLAEEEDKADDIDHALGFLRILISDNAIAYAQDRNARAWTFRSYINNAKFRLLGVSEGAPKILPNFSDPDDLNLKQMWEHLQTNTDLAVGNYANALKSPP